MGSIEHSTLEEIEDWSLNPMALSEFHPKTLKFPFLFLSS